MVEIIVCSLFYCILTFTFYVIYPYLIFIFGSGVFKNVDYCCGLCIDNWRLRMFLVVSPIASSTTNHTLGVFWGNRILDSVQYIYIHIFLILQLIFINGSLEYVILVGELWHSAVKYFTILTVVQGNAIKQSFIPKLLCKSFYSENPEKQMIPQNVSTMQLNCFQHW